MSNAAAELVLPDPGDDFALAARNTPVALITERAIEKAGGSIPFNRFMELDRKSVV